MILQDYLDERKKSSMERSSLLMGTFTAGVSLVQFLVRCSFSYALMVYRKVSIVETHSGLI